MKDGGDSKRLSELTVGDAKRIAVYGAATLLALTLFVMLVGRVLVALLLGVVAGAYLLPLQEWLERRLRARAGSALVTIGLIVVPLLALAAYGWYELSGYSNTVHDRREEIIAAISRSLSQYVSVENTRAGLELAFSEALIRSGEAIQEFRKQSALLLASAAVFFFTVFYVLTQRVRLAAYIKLRVPGDFMPLYEKLSENVGGALRGALFAVLVDQSLKATVILLLNFIFGVPLAVALALTTFLLGFFPLLGEWAVYVPVSVYLLVFRGAPASAATYLCVGVALTLASSLVLRPRLAARGARLQLLLDAGGARRGRPRLRHPRRRPRPGHPRLCEGGRRHARRRREVRDLSAQGGEGAAEGRRREGGAGRGGDRREEVTETAGSAEVRVQSDE